MGAHLGGLGPGAAILLLKHDLVLLHIPPDGLGRGINTRTQHTQSLVHMLHRDKTGTLYMELHASNQLLETCMYIVRVAGETQTSEDTCDAHIIQVL